MEMMNDENALPRSTSYRCGICCARPGEEHAADCTEANIARAAIIAADMLAELDPAKVPLAVPAAISVLLAAINAGPAASRRAAGGEAAQQLRVMRAAFHANMLRAFPDKTHDEIAAEIDRAVGVTPAPASAGQAAPGGKDTVKELLDAAFQALQHDAGEQDEEYRFLRKNLGDSFGRILKRAPLAAQPAEGAGQADHPPRVTPEMRESLDAANAQVAEVKARREARAGQAGQVAKGDEMLASGLREILASAKGKDNCAYISALASDMLNELTERAAAPADPGGELWRALIRDTGSVPCEYPCLRDDLADWLATHQPSAQDGGEA